MWLWLCPAVFLLGLLQEASPGPACRISEFPCRNGRCVRLNAYCDGNDDCGDLSDEPLYCTAEHWDAESQLNSVPAADIDSAPDAVNLSSDVLTILGDDGIIVSTTGPPLLADVASRWSAVLTAGLQAEVRQTLMAKYPPPSNCQLLRPPQCNQEVVLALTTQNVRRDQRLATQQAQLSAALGALGLVLAHILTKKEGGGDRCLEPLSDASRLLADLYHTQSVVRRELISQNINNDLKATLLDTTVDGFLFGEDLSTRVKTQKSLEASGLDLKKQTSRERRPKIYPSKAKQGNSQPPSRQRQSRLQRDGENTQRRRSSYIDRRQSRRPRQSKSQQEPSQHNRQHR